jgi:integrase
MRLLTYFEKYYLAVNPGLAFNTVRLYKYSITNFGRFIGKIPDLADLTNENLAGYMRSFVDGGLSVYSANKERSQLLAIARSARDDGLIDKVPRVKALPKPERIPTALHPEQVQQLREACTILEAPESLQMRFLIGLQYATGERIGACLALEWAHFDARNRQVIFLAENRKGGKRTMVKSLPGYVVADFQNLPKNGDRLIFANWQGRTTCYTRMSRVFRSAGVEKPPGKLSHLFRSTHATQVKLAGGDPTESLGHSSSAITKRHYIDPRFFNNEVQIPQLGELDAG